MRHLDADALAAGLPSIRSAPAEAGTLEMIVSRPVAAGREVLEAGRLTTEDGLVGDGWRTRGSRSTPDGSADPERQVTVIGSRFIDLLARGDRAAWPLAGDQLYVDLDIGEENLPAGSRLAIGDAVIEVTPPPHTGCDKFSARFGSAALELVGTPEGAALRLRGLNARVVQAGPIRRGDAVRTL